MENITRFASLLCVTAVSSGILVFLIPDGRLKKTAEIVISLFFIVAVISVFTDEHNIEINIAVNSFSEISDFSDNFNKYLIEQSKQVTEKLINDELSSVCRSNFSVNTTWHIEDNNICMDSVTVQIRHSDISEISLIKSRIVAVTGITPEVEYQ